MDAENSTEKLTQDLTPEDYEEALHRMKRDLALLQLKRRLRQSDLTAAEILGITKEIVRIQVAKPGALDAL